MSEYGIASRQTQHSRLSVPDERVKRPDDLLGGPPARGRSTALSLLERDLFLPDDDIAARGGKEADGERPELRREGIAWLLTNDDAIEATDGARWSL